MKKKTLVKQYKDNLDGQDVTVNQFKLKEKKGKSYGRIVSTTCPCCGSKLELNKDELWYCAGDKLKFWESEFTKYQELNEADKVIYLQNISSDSQFFELYDKWKFSKDVDKLEEFNCGYSNNIFLPIANTRTIIPDPMVVKTLEIRLKRSLTEEELRNEGQLYYRFKKVSDKWFKGSKPFVIPYFVLPDELSFIPKVDDENL